MKKCILGFMLMLVIAGVQGAGIENGLKPFYISQKYAATLEQRIEKYIALCVRLSGCCNAPVQTVKLLSFSSPGIIHCYNTLIRTGDVSPIKQLWHAHKIGTMRTASTQFKYELCHLLFIVLEHYARQLLGAQNLSKQEQTAADQISSTLPIDELLAMIDLFYQRLVEFLAKTDQQKPGAQWNLPIPKRWVALGMVCLVVASKVYAKWFATPRLPVVALPGALSPAVSPTHK